MQLAAENGTLDTRDVIVSYHGGSSMVSFGGGEVSAGASFGGAEVSAVVSFGGAEVSRVVSFGGGEVK
jgi:hypothetical protein